MLFDQIKRYAIVAGIAAAVGAAVFIEQRIEHRGALKELTRAADSTAAVKDSIHQVTQVAFLADLKKDTAAARALAAQEARDKALHATLDSAKQSLQAARDSALAALADSAATNQRLRADLARVVQASDASEQAHQRVETGLRDDLTAAHALLARRDTTIRDGTTALTAANDLIAATIRQRDLYKDRVPSTTGTVIRAVLTAAAAFEGGRLTATGRP